MKVDRHRQVVVTFTEEQLQRLEREAEDCGVAKSTYLRLLVLQVWKTKETNAVSLPTSR